MSVLAATCASIVPTDLAAAKACRAVIDGKTKPRGSLGRLETLACRIAAVRSEARPAMPNKALVVMAADHGVAAEGVSAYPQEVTAQMLRNFALGGAAVNVLARQVGARIVVVDMGVAGQPEPVAGILQRRVGAGTASFLHGPAMSPQEARAAIETGIDVAATLAREGVTLLGIGDMGIGNTTAASAITAHLTGAPVVEVTGHGTGIDAAARQRKIALIEQAIAVNRPVTGDALDTLAKLGGFEIGGLAGVVLGAAAARVPVLLDGFIATAAAALAVELAPLASEYLIAAHRSVEGGHTYLLRALGLEPLLDLQMRLGEGTGAALVMSLVDASLRIVHEMASFAEAGVTDSCEPGRL